MANKSLDLQILRLGEKHDIDQLKILISKTSTKELMKSLKTRLERKDSSIFWNYLLQSFDITNNESCEKRFACVKCFLDCLLKIELSYKQGYDLITRLCQDLSTFSSEQLVQILEHCIDGMRAGDPKCVSWKDLLPETLTALSSYTQLSVNGISMSGIEYRDITIRNLCTMRWPSEVLTPIADMFKDVNLNMNDLVLVLNKFSNVFQTLTPPELPGLAFQLFSMSHTATQIMIPILGFEKYFYRFYYKQLFADMNSNSTDFESIDAFSDKELREAEETILHHLSYCTQYKISELQMSAVLKNFASLPDVVLTPFILSAILSMTSANRDPDTRLSTAMLLHFLRNVITNNEHERSMSDYSVWCRDALQKKQVNLEDVLTVLIDQNKDGKDVITPGLVNLIFLLLKAKNCPTLNNLAIAFLTKFIRKRFVFGHGVIKKLAEWMVVEQESLQYSECLTLLSVADTFTVSECVKTINYVMDFFVWIPGDESMRMMSFILPILKISPIIRDNLIEILRKAMNSSDVKTKRMAVYGFCMILKQLNNSNSQRSQLGVSGFCTQHSISGFSLMSQATLGLRTNPQRHFDMLTLEIIGLLRNCFSSSIDIKLILYEQLQRAVELNPKLVPHVLQFIDWHFRSYFEMNSLNDDHIEFTIKFDKVLQRIGEEKDATIEITDNLGKLILFISHCLVTFEKFENDYDAREIRRIIKLAIDKLIAKEILFEALTGTTQSSYNKELILQQMHLIEGLMANVLLTSKQTNDNVQQLLPLFRIHQKLYDNLKSFNAAKKLHKKTKNLNEEKEISHNISIYSKPNTKFNFDSGNIWDLPVLEMFLRLLHEDIVPFAATHNTNILRTNCEFVRYVLEVTSYKIEAIRTEPDYKQLSHSRRTLNYLTNITKVVYERCIKRLMDLYINFDFKTATISAECFKQCLQTANKIYKKKFVEVFVKGFDFHVINKCKEAPAMLHDVIDAFMTNSNLSQQENYDSSRIVHLLLECLEILYDNVTYSNRICIESYTWLLNFCKTYEVHSKDIGLVFKLLFIQRQKTHSGVFFNTITENLGRVLGLINEQTENESTEIQKCVSYKSITLLSADSCLQYLLSTVRKQIENVEYFIIKANNSSYKYRILPDDDRDVCLANLQSLERSMCSELVHISNTLLQLTNVCVPLGNTMDNLIKLLTQHYICLRNLAKHFIGCSSHQRLCTQGTKFDILLQVVGKPLPTNIYALITYIEANILEVERKKKQNPQAEKAKVLRETKLIPKLIMCIENFNKNVIVLAKKTNDRLANLLHFGTVRDFRIKTSDLKAAIARTLSHSSEIEMDLSEHDVNELESNDEETCLDELESENSTNGTSKNVNDGDCSGSDNVLSTLINKEKNQISQKSKKNRKKILSDDDDEGTDEPTPENASILENESNKESATQLLENIAKINKRAKKRSLRDIEHNDPDVMSAPALQNNKRRGRGGKRKCN